jgi:hypothetical protein
MALPVFCVAVLYKCRPLGFYSSKLTATRQIPFALQNR